MTLVSNLLAAIIISTMSDNLDRIKASFEKMGITYDNDDDYLEAWHNLVGYFDTLIQMDLEQKRKQSNDEKSTKNL